MTHYKTELTYFRAFICILIVLVHILTQYMGHVEDSETSELKLLYYIQNIIIFATPSFIILSQLLTTLNYKTVDRHYLWKRVKYILCPYLLVGTFYAYSEHKITGNTFTEEWWKSVILGHWHGYFILIIMQFFVLSYLLYKGSPRIFDSKTVLVLSFIVQFSFLHLYNENAVFAKYFTAFYPFSENTCILGWIFFFFMGGYIGRHYHQIIQFLNLHIFIVLGVAILSYLGFIAFGHHIYWYVTSFSAGLMCYSSVMFLLLLGVATHFNTLFYSSVQLISTFSFFIYLLHPIIIDSLYHYFTAFTDMTLVFLAISLLFTLGICIGVGLLLRQFRVCRFVVGKQPYKMHVDYE